MGIGQGNRAILGADPASCTFGFIHITGASQHLDTEVPSSACYFLNIGVCYDFYIRRPTGLYQLGSKYSDSTVVGWKGLIQTCHDTAYG
jgi:hypothetical protein